jgi:selenocysteine lyase/cysteine desulfurase
MDLDDVRSLWDPKTVYLNSATYGLPPRTSWDALQNALDEWRGGRVDFLAWDGATSRARAAWSRIVGVPEEWVAVGSTVAGLLAPVAASFPAGTRILIPDIEFTSLLWPWMAHADRGLEVITVPCSKYVEAIDESVDLVAFSVVQSATGEVLNMDEVTSAARNCGAQVFVDASQACGWLPINASTVDYLVSDAYKWLMSPRGTSFLSVNPERLESIRPLAANWYAGEDVHSSYYGPPLRLAHSARRLDVSPAWFSWVGTTPSLELIEAVGVENVHRHNVGLANRFRRGLGLPEGDSAIVSADWPNAATRLEQAGVMATTRAGSLRASFHLYNTEADVDTALEALVA